MVNKCSTCGGLSGYVEQWEANLIGKGVQASMDGKTWFAGTLLEVIDLFTPYRVRLASTDEVRAFSEVRPTAVMVNALSLPVALNEFRHNDVTYTHYKPNYPGTDALIAKGYKPEPLVYLRDVQRLLADRPAAMGAGGLSFSEAIAACEAVRESGCEATQGAIECIDALRSLRAKPVDSKPAAWVSPLRYGSAVTFYKPVKPENWDDDEDEWYCYPLFKGVYE